MKRRIPHNLKYLKQISVNNKEIMIKQPIIDHQNQVKIKNNRKYKAKLNKIRCKRMKNWTNPKICH